MSGAIRVLKFVTHPEMRPKRGDPATEQVDRKGFLIDDRGNRRMELQHVDWVYYASPTSMRDMATAERVDHLIPDPVFLRNSPESMKAIFMQSRWAAIEPHYQAWKSGQEVPTNGTALGAWPGLTQEQASAFRSLGIRTVEEVRDLTDGQIDRIPLPSVREIRRQAKLFIENLGTAVAADRERVQADLIANMQAQMAEMREELARNRQQAPSDDNSEVEQLRAELDRMGHDYDKRWAAPKLREKLHSLTEQAA